MNCPSGLHAGLVASPVPALSRDGVHVPVFRAVGVGAALGDESDLLPVRRPGGQHVVVFAPGQIFDLARAQVEQAQVPVTLRQVAFDVLLELETVDDQRRHGFLVLLVTLGVARVGVLDDQGKTFGVRRPGEILHPALDLRDALGLAARERQEPDLVVLVLVAAAGQEGERPAVGTPARVRLLVLAGGERAVFRAVPPGEPQVGGAFIFGEVHRADRVGDGRAVGRKLRVADRTQEGDVLGLQRTRVVGTGGRAGREGNDQTGHEQRQGDRRPVQGARQGNLHRRPS